MQLLRTWRRRTFGAAIGAAAAPVAIIVAALAVGLGGGGLASLGALGQALDGPRLPATAPLARPGDTRAATRLLARVRRDAAAAVDGPTTATAPTGGGTTGRDGTQPPGTGFDPGATDAPPPTTPRTVPTPGPTATPPPASGTPSPVRQVGDSVRAITDRLPVVGEPTGQVVDGVIDRVDDVIQP